MMPLRSHADEPLAALADRARRYGVELDPRSLHDLTIGAGSHATLRSIAEPGSEGAPTHILRTRNLDDVKRWIGVPDPVFDDAFACRRTPLATGWLAFTRCEDTLRERVKRLDPNLVYRLADAYIRGDSRPLRRYKAVVEQFFGEFAVSAWVFGRIVVGPRAVLDLEAGHPIVLIAHTLEIATSGRVRSSASLTTDCLVLRELEQ